MKSSPKDEPFRLRLGAALKCRQEPYHRCLILSDPETNGGYIVLVRVTTDDGKWRDRDCILTPADWTELDRNSTVAYSTALCGRVEAELLKAMQTGEFEVIASPAPEVLRKVIAAGRAAEGMPPKAQALLAQI
ncbi:MAG TPA: hypothetical protein VNN22_18705 [Verrucomicrobiae bacterium]|nr:hypothetical protein [Verrucomicrobiae bacterium]